VPAWEVREPTPLLGAPRVLPLAQFLDSYIVAQEGESLLLVDQHAAHERVLFERFLAQAEVGAVEVQRLLFPRVLDLTPAQLAALDEEGPELRRLGFHVEPFGPGAVRLDAVPALLQDEDPEELLRGVWGRAGDARSARADLAPLRHRLVTTAACKAAIKIRHPLTREGMTALLEALFRTESPTTCPHGRPVIFRLTREEIERTFRRR